MIEQDRISRFNEYLNKIPLEELQSEAQKQIQKNKDEFIKFEIDLKNGRCFYCNNLLTHFSKDKPCFHWLLKPKGFKKKYFPLLFEQKSFRQLNDYLRWVANTEKPMQNINDLIEEKESSKFIEETIRYKNFEWSFSCSHSDRLGHKDKHKGKVPHYHFQMKVDNLVIINYNGFHLSFTDYDEFYFTVKDGKFDRLRSKHIQGAGMQSFFDNIKSEEIIDNLMYAKDEKDGQLNIDIMIEANAGTTISGDEIADLIKERDRTGISMAKLIKKLKNVNVQTIISPGPGIPKMARRDKNR